MRRHRVSNVQQRTFALWRMCCVLCGRTQIQGRVSSHRHCRVCGGFLEALPWEQWERYI
jgi:hypothetical protein